MVQALSNLKQAQIFSQINMRVAKKVLDAQKMDGAAALKLLDAASQVTAQAGDQLVAAATGLGAQLDVRA